MKTKAGMKVVPSRRILHWKYLSIEKRDRSTSLTQNWEIQKVLKFLWPFIFLRQKVTDFENTLFISVAIEFFLSLHIILRSFCSKCLTIVRHGGIEWRILASWYCRKLSSIFMRCPQWRRSSKEDSGYLSKLWCVVEWLAWRVSFSGRLGARAQRSACLSHCGLWYRRTCHSILRSHSIRYQHIKQTASCRWKKTIRTLKFFHPYKDLMELTLLRKPEKEMSMKQFN